MSINDSLVENLKQMQLANGLSQAELAAKLGVSPARLYHILTKRRNIGMNMFKKIVAVFPGFTDLLQQLVKEEGPSG